MIAVCVRLRARHGAHALPVLVWTGLQVRPGWQPCDACSQPSSCPRREDGPAAFPDRQGALPAALFHPTPVHPRAQAGPDVRIYDANTGKLIRKGAAGPGPPGSLAVHAEHSSFRYMSLRGRAAVGCPGARPATLAER